MKSFQTLCAVLLGLTLGFAALSAHAQTAQIKGLGRFEGWRDNALIGQGIVVGLAGSGDSQRSTITRQALRNMYDRLGTSVSEDDLASRNVAVVVAVATLPASANVGDRIAVTVSSAGDARSLAGGTLLMTPLSGPDGKAYALAQGSLVAGGDNFESQLNVRQRNYPTTARLENGATVETSVEANLLTATGDIDFLLADPNFTTADRIASAINARFGETLAEAESADQVRIHYNQSYGVLTRFVSQIENLSVEPDRVPRIVINERTGTVVAGADVAISNVVISQGDIRVTVTSENTAAQPGYLSGINPGVQSLVITNTDLSVERGANDVVAVFPNTSVADLITGLSRAHVDTRRVISILQAIRSAGALQAEIIVQ